MELATLFYYAIWTILAIQGVRHKLVKAYPLFYAYLAVTIAGFTASMTAYTAWGARDPRYLPTYLASTLAIHALEIVLVLRIHYLAEKPSWKRDWQIFAGIAVAIGIELSFAPFRHYFWNTLHIVYLFEAYAAFRTVMRVFSDERIQIGRNMGAVLGALFMQSAVLATNHAGKLASPEGWPHFAFEFIIQATQMTMWVIILQGMKEPDPPRIQEPAPWTKPHPERTRP